MNKKKILFPVLAVAVVGGAIFGLTQVDAQTGSQGLAQAIASKFGINETQVQSTIDSYRQTSMQTMQKKRLDNLVSQGKITSQQETDILNEISKLKSEYSPTSMKAMSAADRKAQFQKEQQEVQSWAQSKGINAKYVMPFGGMRGRGVKFGHKQSTTPTPTP